MSKELNIIAIKDKVYVVDTDTLYPIADYIENNGNLEARRIKKDTRTILQNSSMHKYFSLVAQSLNDTGLSMQKVMEAITKIEIEWTMSAVKETIWRNFQKALLEKESTTQLETDEVSKVYKYVDFWLQDRFGVDHINIPSVESIIMEKRSEESA